MSLPSVALFLTEDDQIIGAGFVNCGWIDSPGSILGSIPRAYENAKDYASSTESDRTKKFIQSIEDNRDCKLFPDNWEQQWRKVSLYGVIVNRSDLIKLGKNEITADFVEDNIRVQREK